MDALNTVISVLITVTVVNYYGNAQNYKSYGAMAFDVPALIVFGDSTVDAGMNNNLSTVVRANFLPYGENFMNGNTPTGRFCDGKIPIDFVGDFLKLPSPLPYFHPEAKGQNILKGINFASSASGYNQNTAKIFNVISLQQQMEFYKSYRAQVQDMVGEEQASYILTKGLYVLSTGSNDYANNYFYNLRLKRREGIVEYTNSLLQNANDFMEELYLYGVRKLAVVNVPPLGCLPSQRSILGVRRFDIKDCLDTANEDASSFNQGLQNVISNLKVKYPDFGVVYLDCYSPLFDIYHSPSKYGVEVVTHGCCSLGRVETAILCNPLDAGLSCKDPSKYMFWDSFHPTQYVYNILTDMFIKTVLAANIL